MSQPSSPTSDVGADAVWVISDVAPDGTYVVTVQPNPDVAITLDRDRAVRYACTVIAAATRAKYDAAVFTQMAALGLKPESALEPIREMRLDLPPLDDAATAPLRFQPILGMRTRLPAVHVWLEGADQPFSEWSPTQARQHGLHVLEVLVAADLDACYRRVLVSKFEIGDGRAREAVGDLRRHLETVVDDF